MGWKREFLSVAIEAGPVLLVTNTADAGADSLRDQIAATTTPGHRILFDASPGGAFETGGTILLAGTQLDLNGARTVFIDASDIASPGVTVDGNNMSRVLRTRNGANLTLHSLTLSGGTTGTGASGAGLFCDSGATLTLLRSTVTGNTSGTSGGGLNVGGTGSRLFAINSTITNNQCAGSGGGLNVFASARSAILLHTTVAGNTAATDGSGSGGGVRNNGGNLTLENSILSGNLDTATPDDLSAAAAATTILAGTTIIQTALNGTTTGTLTGPGTILQADPLLDPLADNGGPTQTMRPQFTSPAIDAAGGVGPPGDQRGLARFSGPAPDIGAVELQQLVVDTTGDENDGIDAGLISLRDAIDHNVPGEGELIRFDPLVFPGTITLGVPGGGGSGQLTIARDLAIDASNITTAPGVTINADNNSRVFEIASGGHTVTLDSLTLTGGNANGAANPADQGGAIYHDDGTLNLVDCTFDLNNSIDDGGALFTAGTLVVDNTTFSNNTAGPNPTLSTFSNGGAIFLNTPANATINNSTFSGNDASERAGAIWVAGALNLNHATLSGNNAGVGGGGIRINSGTLNLDNTIVASNTALADIDIQYNSGTLTATGVNLLSDLTGSTLVDGANVDVGNPLLAPLANYGGPTQTHFPLPGSPAIDTASTGLATDQRGVARPVGGSPDIGAVEAFCLTTPAITDTDGDGMDDGIEVLYGFVVATMDGHLDADGDGSTNAEELANKTDPNDATDVFRITSLTYLGDDGMGNPMFQITFPTFPGLDYTLEFNVDLDFTTPVEISLGPAPDFEATETVTLDPGGRDYIRARRD